jgi:hypothetical protein
LLSSFDRKAVSESLSIRYSFANTIHNKEIEKMDTNAIIIFLPTDIARAPAL